MPLQELQRTETWLCDRVCYNVTDSYINLQRISLLLFSAYVPASCGTLSSDGERTCFICTGSKYKESHPVSAG